MNVPIPVPDAYYSLGGWKNSLFDQGTLWPPGDRPPLQGRPHTPARPGDIEGRPRVPADSLIRLLATAVVAGAVLASSAAGGAWPGGPR